MNGQYTYTPEIWPSFLAALLFIALAVYSWRRRSVPGAKVFAISCLFAVAWAVGLVMEAAAVNVTTKIFWVKFQGLWKLPTATLSMCFMLEYAWPGRWLTRRNMVLLSIPPLLMAGMIVTDNLYHLLWQGFAYAGDVIPQRTSLNWFFIGYGYLLGVVYLIVLAWLFFHSPSHRWPVMIMLIGQLVGRSVFLLEASRIVQSGLLVDAPPPALEYLIYAIALFGFRIFDPIPLARQTAIEQMRAGMLVLDHGGKVVSLNPTAERFLGIRARQLKGKSARGLLSGNLDEALTSAGETETEFSLGEGEDSHHYRITVSPLQDFRRLEIGRLLMLRDVTGQKRAQVQLLEHQRALAMLQEREQLARELHDNLGQVFAFVSAQGQAIRRLLDTGDLLTAHEYINRLIDVAREADVDIRESILGLGTTLSSDGLVPSLTQYLAKYEKNYGIRVQLEDWQTFTDRMFDPLVEVQLLRILQEALTNVRKHAGPCSVRIAFAQEDSYARVTIQDNGQGFDMINPVDDWGAHMGLSVMRERAEEVGGSLSMYSQPGEGTELVLHIPVRGAVHA